MTSISVAVKIWAKIIALSGFSCFLFTLFTGQGWGLLIGAGFFVLGFIIMLPLLMLISPLVKLSALVPYSYQGRMAWLSFYLTIMHLFAYTPLFFVIDSNDNEVDAGIWQLVFFTIVVVSASVLTTRKSLNEFYTQS